MKLINLQKIDENEAVFVIWKHQLPNAFSSFKFTSTANRQKREIAQALRDSKSQNHILSVKLNFKY